MHCFARGLKEGFIDFTISMRVANIDVIDTYTFPNGAVIHEMTSERLESIYPFDSSRRGASVASKKAWGNHRAEIVWKLKGKPKDIGIESSIERTEGRINWLLHGFLLADLPENSFTNHRKIRPHVTHVRTSSILGTSVLERSSEVLWGTPPRVGTFHLDQVSKGIELCEQSTQDKILSIALDRLFKSIKTNYHHPNRVNQPNWDKVVDLAIALEVILLTTEGSPADSELSYRFRLIGASALSLCTPYDKPTLFTALKLLYQLRSKAVHGADDEAIAKPARKILEVLSPASKSPTSSLQCLIDASSLIEKMLRNALVWLATFDRNSRPYYAAQGWERLIWNSDSNAESKAQTTITPPSTQLA